MTHNYLDATNGTTGERLNYRARHTTTLQLLYDDHKEKGFSAVLWDQFSNDYRFDGQDYTYNTLNFSFRKKLSGGFAVYGGVDDIFDKKSTTSTSMDGCGASEPNGSGKEVFMMKSFVRKEAVLWALTVLLAVPGLQAAAKCRISSKRRRAAVCRFRS